MKFLSRRDRRNRPGMVRNLAKKDDLVLTANGKPIALLVGIDEDELEEASRAVRQARAQMAVSRMRKHAARAGTSRMSLKTIEAEVRKVRTQRKTK